MPENPPFKSWKPKIYSGIGSRKAPAHILKLQEKIGRRLSELDWTLRSGGAIGSDQAFEKFAANKEIYYADQRAATLNKGIFIPLEENDKALELLRGIHPKFDSLTESSRLLHRRNLFQVLGADLKTPTKFVVCWTPCGAEKESEIVYRRDHPENNTGGSATVIRTADRNNISVFNFKKIGSLERFYDFMKENP